MFKKISFCSIFSIAAIIPLFSCASTSAIPTNIQATKINIDTIITDTDMGEMQVEPSTNYIIENFIYPQALNAGHPDLVNDLNIQRDSSTQATVSVVNDYSEYTGSVAITWVLTNKIDLSTVFTTNLTDTYREVDLLAMNGSDINPYFKQIVTETYAARDDIRWNQLNLQNVDFTSSVAKKAGAGTITITPKPYSDVYTGVGTITFPETFTTLQTREFTATPRTTQSFTAPQDGNYILEAWGSNGGGCGQAGLGTRGRGAYVSGTIYLQKDQTIYVYVGDNPNDKNNPIKPFNGGGSRCYGTTNDGDRSGGGAADFRLKANDDSYPDGWSDPLSLNSRIMVAGGGGGYGYKASGSKTEYFDGGAGGLTGFPLLGAVANDACGATQTSGGLANIEGGVAGSFGAGANCRGSNFDGAGGGGYYGGSMNNNSWSNSIRGTGGSSFISGYNGCIAIANPMSDESDPRTPKTTGDISVLNYDNQDWRVYSFLMIDGKSNMYLQNGTLSTGNSGTGYARISYITY